ncbi:tRNA methyltransferase complex subunit Cpd1 [Suillus cothurnatus]|nr:tRNA methyltransferase complex subunit Cpd1 [Suillus cothurnatus]
MWSIARNVAAGDLVIIWQGKTLTPGLDITGMQTLLEFLTGPKSDLAMAKDSSTVLRPTPELWTMALPHRTQILYLADIAFITSWLDIKRGSSVIEAGTGSGSFSHSVARTIGSVGHLWSYEFHEARANKAREEFSLHGMADIVTLTHRNVCKDGFTVEDTVDAVFLDLPAPWDAIEHAKKALKKTSPTRICCFSPCMEQVLRTVSALNDFGFTDITMFETLLRPHEVHQQSPQSLTQAVEKLKKLEQKREDKRQHQIARSSKRKRDDLLETDADNLEAKRLRTQESAEEDVGIRDIPDAVVDPGQSTNQLSPIKISVSKVSPDVRGHTSYLTFARLGTYSSFKNSRVNIK